MHRKYFAYGSNLFVARLRERVPSAEAIGVYTLPKHDLRFHKRSDKDGSAKCDAFATDDENDFVIGRVFNIAQNEESKLDKAEGLGNGYDKKNVRVFDDTGNFVDAFTYCATDIDKTLRPYTWYKKHVVAGAKEGSLPDAYIKKIETVAADKDINRSREKRELSLHR